MSDSYKIGQMVLTDNDLKLTPVKTKEYESRFNTSYNKIFTNTLFEDLYIDLEEGQFFNPSENYYLTLTIAKDPEFESSCVIKLLNLETGAFREIRSDIRTYKDRPSEINIIFNPIEASYNSIVLEMQRGEEDFLYMQKNDSPKGRILALSEYKIEVIKNILANYDENGKIISIPHIVTELGLQGKPGQLFTIEGEELRIGKSGVYEMHFENIGINNIGIIPQKNTLILDYKYKEAK